MRLFDQPADALGEIGETRSQRLPHRTRSCSRPIVARAGSVERAPRRSATGPQGREREADGGGPAADRSRDEPHAAPHIRELVVRGGRSPAYVKNAMGHTSAALALEVYAKKMERNRDTGARMDALIHGADLGTNGHKWRFALRVTARAGNREAADDLDARRCTLQRAVPLRRGDRTR
jgi:hypothetical protein